MDHHKRRRVWRSKTRDHSSVKDQCPISVNDARPLSSTYQSFRDSDASLALTSIFPNDSSVDHYQYTGHGQVTATPVVTDSGYSDRCQTLTHSPRNSWFSLGMKCKTLHDLPNSTRKEMADHGPTKFLTLSPRSYKSTVHFHETSVQHNAIPPDMTHLSESLISRCLRSLTIGSWRHWLGSLSQRSGRVCHAKRVAPPIVPESTHHRHSGSSFGSGGSTESSGGYCSGSGSLTGRNTPSTAWSSDQRSSIGFDETFPPPASPSAVEVQQQQHQQFLINKSMYRESESIYSGRNLPSPNHAPIFTFPAAPNSIYGHIVNRSGSQPSSPHCCNMERDFTPTTLLPHPNYCHQASMDDQGIDLTQSPGRESPSSSTGSSTTSGGIKSSSSTSNGANGSTILPGCRHSTTSTTSLDSGRASAYDHAHRHGSSSSSSTSTSASTGPPGCILAHQHRFSGQSYENCLRHSYHSSSSSLGSSGKSDDIHRLNVAEMLSQGVPEHEILNAWLTDLGFEEYYDLFVQSGYDMHTITRMTPEDLTAIGIQKPNHRKKLKAEIALLHIPDGLPEFIPDTLEEWLSILGLAEYSPSLRRQGYRTVEDVTQLTWEDLEDFGILRLGHQKKITLAIKRVKDILAGKYVPHAVDNSCCYVTQEVAINTGTSITVSSEQHEMTTFHQYRPSHYAVPPSILRPVYVTQHSVPQLPQQPQPPKPVYYHFKQPTYQPDVVAIQVHRNRSSEDIRSSSGNNQGPVQYPNVNQQTTFYKPSWRQRSYEDGDITPVSEHVNHGHGPGGGTLPRPRGTVKPRPVAKISAKSRADSDTSPGEDFKPANPQYIYGTIGKKNPPPTPPKRSLSAEEDSVYGRIAKTSPLPLPPPPPTDSLSLLSYSEDSEDFPPPPAPITASDSYLQHGQAAAAASVRERLDHILQRSGAGHWPRPHPQAIYGSANATSRPSNAVLNMKLSTSRERECSPCESIDTSDTEPGSPAMEFRQRRNGSDASFKSTSSTESDSMPFANDNAGTIKQRNARAHPALAALSYASHSPAHSPALSRRTNTTNSGTSDVLNDIGNMLAGLSDELDAMLEEENKHPIKQNS